jgi:hypothetical protein
MLTWTLSETVSRHYTAGYTAAGAPQRHGVLRGETWYTSQSDLFNGVCHIHIFDLSLDVVGSLFVKWASTNEAISFASFSFIPSGSFCSSWKPPCVSVSMIEKQGSRMLGVHTSNSAIFLSSALILSWKVLVAI